MVSPSEYKHAVIEVLPLERFALSRVNELIHPVSEALAKVGFSQPLRLRGGNLLAFQLTERDRLRQLLASVLKKEENEYEWLIVEFFDVLVVAHSSQDILFGFVSSRDPNVPGGPYSRTPSYIAIEFGGPLGATSLARFVCVAALKETWAPELGTAIDAHWSLPVESALQASIEFGSEIPDSGITTHDVDTDIVLRPIEFISSRLLLSQEIVPLLQEESKLNQLLVARATPYQFFCSGGGDDRGFGLFNHFCIKAKSGAFAELVGELLLISLHFNWAHATKPGDQLSTEQRLAFAIAQSGRLKKLEERESSVRHALGVLQKRYPARTDLVQWEVNNQYSNVVRYSPIYTRWKQNLSDVLQGEKHTSAHWLSALLSQIDWSRLEKAGLAKTEQATQLLELVRVDPAATLAKVRVLTEKMISHLFQQYFAGQSTNLAEMIQRLNDIGCFPSIMYAAVNYLRITGNIGAHSTGVEKEDAEAVLPIFVRFVEFYLDSVLGHA